MGPADAADPVRLQPLCRRSHTQDQFRGSSTDVDHQSALSIRGQTAGDPEVDQAGLFPAGYDIDGMPQQLVGGDQKLVPIAGFPQGLRGDRPHLPGFETRQTFTKTGQTFPATLHRIGRQIAVLVQPTALTHGLFQVLRPQKLSMINTTNLQPKAVRAQINGGQPCAMLHCRYRFRFDDRDQHSTVL